MQLFQEKNDIGFLVNDINRMLKKLFDQRVRAHGVSTAQWSVLVHLLRKDGTSQIELSELLEIEQPTLVRHLDNLEAQELIERKADKIDRRVKRIFLKNRCNPLSHIIHEIAQQTKKDVLTGITKKELDQATKTLTILKKNIIEVMGTDNSKEGIADEER